MITIKDRVTELDAKQKWCPFARSMKAIEPDQIDSNRHVEDEFDKTGNQRTSPQVGCHCLASGCMLWEKTGQVFIDHQGKRSDRDMNGNGHWHDTGRCSLGTVTP